MFKKIFGLGNPEPQYIKTRHNAGYMFIDSLDENKCFIKAGPSMNVCGTHVVAKTGNNPVSNILIVLDDFNIPLGEARYSPGGSDGGHNGLKSVIAAFNTEDIPRLRIGIGPAPSSREEILGFVLGDFSEEELKKINEVISVCKKWITEETNPQAFRSKCVPCKI